MRWFVSKRTLATLLAIAIAIAIATLTASCGGRAEESPWSPSPGTASADVAADKCAEHRAGTPSSNSKPETLREVEQAAREASGEFVVSKARIARVARLPGDDAVNVFFYTSNAASLHQIRLNAVGGATRLDVRVCHPRLQDRVLTVRCSRIALPSDSETIVGRDGDPVRPRVRSRLYFEGKRTPASEVPCPSAPAEIRLD